METLGAGTVLVVEDEREIRELLRTRRPAAELFVDPSPPSGLLIGPEIEIERVIRRCRSLGVEIEADGGLLRARSHSLHPTPLPGSTVCTSAPRASGRLNDSLASSVTGMIPMPR